MNRLPFFGTRGFISLLDTEIRWDSVLSLIFVLSQRTCFLLWSCRVLCREAELSTDHHLVICILRGLNHPRTRKRFRAQLRAHKIKWELLADKKVRPTFASKVASLFRELPDYTEDVETEWDLFKSAVITSAAASCGCKRLEGHKGKKKYNFLVESKN